MGYAKRKYLLSKLAEKLSYFVCDFYEWGHSYNDSIGTMLYVEDGDSYFSDGILDLSKVKATEII